MDKIKRATELNNTLTPHQMALRIVELQDALELADEAVRAKQVAVPDCWKLVPTSLTEEMLVEWLMADDFDDGYKNMLTAAPKPEGWVTGGAV